MEPKCLSLQARTFGQKSEQTAKSGSAQDFAKTRNRAQKCEDRADFRAPHRTLLTASSGCFLCSEQRAEATLRGLVSGAADGTPNQKQEPLSPWLCFWCSCSSKTKAEKTTLFCGEQEQINRNGLVEPAFLFI